MKNDTIVHFVYFSTDLEPGEFVPVWEYYAKRIKNKQAEPSLQEKLARTKSRYKYYSQHECNAGDFCFAFIKDRISESFPDHNVKMIHTGGYLPLQLKGKQKQNEEGVRLVACLNQSVPDMDFYQDLSPYQHLNIYQAYYENCTYSYILEYFVSEKDAEELEQKLRHATPAEMGIYKECLALHA